ncbi:lipopolysaccharide biosynthesis protein [Aeromonas media]|uniref:lipopolysaccharide biosynthesis protein n=2 Tax=Aeromonas TaxID=642 RepID=UPI0038CF685E
MMVRRTALYMVGDVLSKISPFIILPLLTRIFSPEEFAIYANYLLGINILCIFINGWSIAYLYPSFYKSKTRFKLVSSISVYVSFIIIILSFFLLIFSWSMSSSVVELWSLVFFSGAVFSINTVYTTILQIKGDAVRFSYFNVGKSIFQLLLVYMYISLRLEPTVIGVVYIYLVTSIIYMLFALFKLCRDRLLSFFVFSIFKDALSYGAPLIPNMALGYAKTSIDRVILLYVFGVSVIGVYSASFQLFSVIILFSSSLIKGITPELLSSIKSCNAQKVRKITFFYIVSVVCVCVCVWCGMYFGGALFLGESFGNLKPYSFLSLSIALGAIGSIFTAYYQIFEKTKLLMSITIFTTLLHMLSLYLGAKLFEVNGFIFCHIISSLISVFILYAKGFRYVV